MDSSCSGPFLLMLRLVEACVIYSRKLQLLVKLVASQLGMLDVEHIRDRSSSDAMELGMAFGPHCM